MHLSGVQVAAGTLTCTVLVQNIPWNDGDAGRWTWRGILHLAAAATTRLWSLWLWGQNNGQDSTHFHYRRTWTTAVVPMVMATAPWLVSYGSQARYATWHAHTNHLVCCMFAVEPMCGELLCQVVQSNYHSCKAYTAGRGPC